MRWTIEWTGMRERARVIQEEMSKAKSEELQLPEIIVELRADEDLEEGDKDDDDDDAERDFDEEAGRLD